MKLKFLKIKKAICTALACALTLTALTTISTMPVIAKESIGNGVILSTDSLTITEGAVATFTAVMPEGFDASRLACVVADPNVATAVPIAYAANAAAFQINYVNTGNTVAAVYNIDNPAIVAYLNINTSSIIVTAPAKLGTNHSNYCKLVGYEFKPYDFTYRNFNDYKYTMTVKYQLVAYGDKDYSKWGCYGYFYDAAGNVISKVHLYCNALSKNRIYSSDFNVPVNAVRFSIEGF